MTVYGSKVAEVYIKQVIFHYIKYTLDILLINSG